MGGVVGVLRGVGGYPYDHHVEYSIPAVWALHNAVRVDCKVLLNCASRSIPSACFVLFVVEIACSFKFTARSERQKIIKYGE